MIRLILIATILILYLIIGIPVLLIEWVIGKFNPRARDISSLRMVQAAFKLMLWITGSDITYIGHENVPKDQAVLYVGNHCSYFDILLTSVRAPRPTGYVAKIEMLRYPLLRNWMRNIRCTFLDRKDVKKGMKTILDNIALLKNGISVCVFPEGTRNRTSASLLEFHDGSLKMAEKSGCPIVPMAINNSGAIFEDHLPKIVKSHVVIEYCDPIYMEDLSKEEKRFIGKQVADIIVTHYEKNKELV